MTVTSVVKDPGTATMTATATFDASPEQVWRLWADPRLLERWWGPPVYPATVVEHDLTPGGRVTYFMTGPTGDQPRGWWRVILVDAPYRLEFEDGFADDAGNPDPAMPTTMVRVTVEPRPHGGSVMTIESTFASADVMDQLLGMGMEEGLTAAMGQMDDILLEVLA